MDKQKHISIKSEKAFTLLEMIVVVVIVGVIVAVAVPVFDTFLASKSLDTAIRQVASDIREAQARAMAEDVYYYGVDFDEPNDRYFVHRDITKAPDILFDETNRVPWGRHGEVTITFSDFKGVKLDDVNFSGKKYVVFQSSGYVADLYNGHVRLVNDAGKTRELTVVSTGKVSIKP